MHELVSELQKFEQDPQIVKVFGAIIYTDRHPHIKKVLKDEDYWRALDEISGVRWAIFSARAIEGSLKITGGGPLGTLGMMIHVWDEPKENRKLVEYLGIPSTEKPLFVLFTRLTDLTILKSNLSLDDSSTENAYKRISKIINDVTSAVENIEHENITDLQSVFNAVDMTISTIRDYDSIRNLIDIYQLFKKVKF